MQKARIAKLFMSGSSQAVRLPAQCRFADQVVYISRNEATGDVQLSTCSSINTWDEFFEFVQRIDTPKTFMADRPMNVMPKDEGAFAHR